MFFNSTLKLWLSCLVMITSGFELNGRGRPDVARRHATLNTSTTNTKTSRHAATKVSTSMKITAPASLASSTCTPHSTVTYESSWNQIIPQNNCTTVKGNCVVHWTACHVYFGSVDMTYWPTSSANGTKYPSTIVRPDLQLTMTSPSVYIVVKTVGYWGGDCARTGPAGHGLFDPPSAVQPCSNDDCLLGDGSGTTGETATPTSVDTGSTTSSPLGVDPSSADAPIINSPNSNRPEPVTTTANIAATITAASDSAPAVDPTTLIPASPTALIPSYPAASSDPIAGAGSAPALDPTPATRTDATDSNYPSTVPIVVAPTSTIPAVTDGSTGATDAILPSDVQGPSSVIDPSFAPGGVKSVSVTQVAVITGGGQTYTRNSASAYVIGSSTLTPGGTVVVSGSSQTMTYLLPTSATAVVVNDVTHAISTATYAVTDGSTGAKSVSDTQVAVITGGGQTYTRNSASAYVIGSSTLTPGGTVVVSGASQTMTYVLPSSATAVVINDVTQAISTANHAITSPAAQVVIGSTTYTANAASEYIVGGMTISPGSTITVSGTNGPTTLGVESTGGAVVINSITYTASTKSVVDTAMTTTGSSTAPTSAGSLKGDITTTIATSLSRAQTVVKDGSSAISFTAGLDLLASSTGTFTTPGNSQASVISTKATAVATNVSAKSASVNFGGIWVVTSLWICGLVVFFVL
ncbi:hypothetical protein BP5796_12563 [Coleophoma crateriformis]|uniref:Uncharacterized protein n=1 Tax=Coleophoma crateriformis TaxID=565419 RepID=A0A3D8Q7G0_9HELO|nr:hypothetical protein BP5796_12563 [Coleophoma crateriformis]